MFPFRHTPRRWLCGVACWVGLALPCWAQTVDDVFPVEPEDGSTVGPRPTLRVGVEGRDVLKVRFRIAMSQDGFETESHVFDQLEDKNGWAHNWAGDGTDGAVYRTRKPLEDGLYEWKASAWNGVDWVEGDTVYRLYIDSIPPATVEDLRLSVDDKGGIRLDWDPITIDQDGRPEYVSRYHIYRSTNKRFHLIRPFEIGVTNDTRFVDRDQEAQGIRLVFYKVIAEDEAGNHHRKRW